MLDIEQNVTTKKKEKKTFLQDSFHFDMTKLFFIFVQFSHLQDKTVM